MIPSLHIATDDGVLERHDFLDTAAALCGAAGGRLALHLRGPTTTGRRLHRLAWDLVARAQGSAILVNDRVDVALTADVAGVHLGQRSLSVSQARSLLGPIGLVGASVHGPAEATEERVAGADYYWVGNVFETSSHPDRPGGGVALVRAVRAATPVPLVAIGGILPDRVEVLLDAGASGVAVLGGIWRSGDPLRALDDFLAALDRSPAPGFPANPQGSG